MNSVLVIDDDPVVCSVVQRVLEKQGFEVAAACDGQSGLSRFAELGPDLVIVDLQMGSMGGMAVCLELHLEESYGNLPHVPVLMLLDRRPDVFLARRSGAEGWVVKPLDPIRLRRAVTSLLDGGTYYDESYQPLSVVSTPLPAGA